MELNLLILEVDGSLANPYAAGAVALWTAVLSALAVVLVRRFTRSGRNRPTWAFLFVAALLVTRPAQLFIGNVLYRIVDPQVTGVGFWGGPPVWIAPVVSCCIGGLMWNAAWKQGAVNARSRLLLVGLIAALLATCLGVWDDWHNAVEAERFASIEAYRDCRRAHSLRGWGLRDRTQMQIDSVPLVR
jgi:hypothetical protein